MLISNQSYFRKPPKVIEPKIVLVFDAIRYSVDICEYAHEKLVKNLYAFSFEENQKIMFAEIFSDVWTIINNSTIFFNTIVKHFKILEDDKIFGNLKIAKFMRHSQQHIEDRIEETLLENQLPLYGSLSWYAQKEIDSTKGQIISIDSGTITNRNKISPTCVNPAGKINNQKINDIEFEMVIQISKKFQTQKIDLNGIMFTIKKAINHFEVQLNQQLAQFDTKERHISDLRLIMNVKKI